MMPQTLSSRRHDARDGRYRDVPPHQDEPYLLTHPHHPIDSQDQSGIKDRRHGERCGGIYGKPFSIKQLHNQIENLLKLRLAFHELMLRSAGTTHETPISEYIQSECDITFMKEVDATLTKHLDEESFSVDNLADAMNMSRTNFYRKLKMLTGMAPNIYIKNFRLNQAAELLAQNMRINEVMLRVGFMAPSYFAKCFKAKFGKLPKEYQNTINKQE